MINQKRVAELCLLFGIDFEMLMLCYNVYIRNQQISPEVNKVIDEYYKKTKKPWLKIIEELEEKGLIENLKPNVAIIELKNLIIMDKFVDEIFINSENVWESFYLRYPSKGISPDGYSYFTANLLDKDDKDYFLKHILKNADKFQANKILYILEDMFNFNPITKKPEGFAKVGVSKFLRNFETIVKQWEEEQSENSGSWGTKRY